MGQLFFCHELTYELELIKHEYSRSDIIKFIEAHEFLQTQKNIDHNFLRAFTSPVYALKRLFI